MVGGAAVAVLAVPVAVLALGGGDGRRRRSAGGRHADPSALEPVEIGRWESWHGVTVLVPEAWQYGDQSTWCAGDGSVDTFRITRPGGASEMIGCTPTSSYGIAFQKVEMDESDEPFDWPVVVPDR